MATTTREVPARRADEASGAAPFRADIQGLRAVAVVAVLVYHLWPHRLTGGYVGVDVFFVISGFLITGHLLRTPVESGRDLLAFWARRVRRLVPAATLVLGCTLAAAVVWLPVTIRADVAREVIASALYVQNWLLAHSVTDYLAADAPPGPVQHYWSLSIEEQFYLGWPILLGGLTWIAVRTARQRWVPAAGIGVVVAASLWWSATLTAADPARAYFVSTTRVWELAAGGLLAATAGLGVGRWSPPLRAAGAWFGLGLIGWAMATYDHTTAFPGVAAAVPVVGTMLVIATAVGDVRGGPGRFLGARPMVWTGDISYSLYLWHWPLIVIAPFVLGADLVASQKLVVAFATFVLAVVTTRVIETPLRHQTDGGRLGPTFVALAICLVVLVGAAALVVASAERHARAVEERVATLLSDPPPCLGAEAARDPACDFPGGALLTPPAFARDDRPVLYADGCWSNRPFTDLPTCTYGPEDGSVRIALVGNSHAGHWQPAIAEAMRDRPWSLTTFLASECYTVDVPVEMGTAEATANCTEWNEWAVGEVSSGAFDLVVMSNRTWRQLVGVDRAERGEVARAAYSRVLDRIASSGTPVLVIRDTPAADANIPDCLARFPHDPSACATDAERGLERDPLAEAGRDHRSGMVHVLEVTHLLCRDGSCPPMVGGVVVYFDHGHMTTTFSATLAPEVDDAMLEALSLSSSTEDG